MMLSRRFLHVGGEMLRKVCQRMALRRMRKAARWKRALPGMRRPFGLGIPIPRH